MYLLLRALILYCAILNTSVSFGLDNKAPLVDVKCSKCHTLKRVFIMCKTESEWRATIEKMRHKNPEWIKPAEAEDILKEILTLRVDRVHAICQERRDYEDTRFLFSDLCTTCHNINRILYQDKTPEEWKATVERMRLEAVDYISVEDAEKITYFLSERAEVLREDAGAKIFLEKCMTCHPGEQILLETHDRTEWCKIIKKCQDTASRTFKTGWLHPYDVELIVDVLVKTQGFSLEKH